MAPHTRSRIYIMLLLLTCTLPHVSNASSAAAPAATPDAAPAGECEEKGEESRVLCAAARAKDASMQQVIVEDEAVRAQNPDPPSPDRAKDAWTNAYKNWVAGDPDTATPPEGVARALEEARKRYAGNTSAKPTGAASLPEAADDELTQITAAAAQIAKARMATAAVSAALDTIDVLCASGDNGRQLAAVGGVPHLLRHSLHPTPAVALRALRALAACAQNNPPVFEHAVGKHGAVSALLNIALETSGELALRAAALRALVAVSEASGAQEGLREREDAVQLVVRDSVATESRDTDGRRCVTRAYALVEQCLRADPIVWKKVFTDAGLVQSAQFALRDGDVDIREGAARVLVLLR